MTRLKTASADPSIYVHNPSVLDPTLAPAGKTALYTLMPVPNLTGSIDWERDRERMQAAMMERLEQIPELSGLSRRVEEALFFTPLDWQNRLDVHQGATFNLAHNLGQMMAFRPHNRFEEIDRVWLVGGGTHPGSGLPTIFESARITSRLLEEEDLRLRDRGHRIKAAVETGRTP